MCMQQLLLAAFMWLGSRPALCTMLLLGGVFTPVVNSYMQQTFVDLIVQPSSLKITIPNNKSQEKGKQLEPKEK